MRGRPPLVRVRSGYPLSDWRVTRTLLIDWRVTRTLLSDLRVTRTLLSDLRVTRTLQRSGCDRCRLNWQPNAIVRGSARRRLASCDVGLFS